MEWVDNECCPGNGGYTNAKDVWSQIITMKFWKFILQNYVQASYGC